MGFSNDDVIILVFYFNSVVWGYIFYINICNIVDFNYFYLGRFTNSFFYLAEDNLYMKEDYIKIFLNNLIYKDLEVRIIINLW